MPKQRRITARQSRQRPPVSQMSEEELHAWIHMTRAALYKKLARKRNYLDRRASRGTHTPTDEAYEGDQRLLADLTSGEALALLLGGQWIEGRVEHGSSLYASERSGQMEKGYYFIDSNGQICGLCSGIKVRLL